ncbi:MAG: HDIG domain-containing protein [Candidatus Aenigmatarchaeota archaeon]|nr:HDIG domain-containing protein [Candidatus Aenigmarchaeota archaeon]
MESLLKLAEKIQDKDLRKKVIDYIKDKKLKNKHFEKYKREDLDKAGSYFSVGNASLGPIERDVVHHTTVLTHLVIQTAKIIEAGYGIKLDMDALVAASICHDIMKSTEYNRDDSGELEPTGISLDHTMLGTAELYARDFPEEVIHIVASHAGEAGTTPPRSFEAVIFHHLDTLASLMEYYALGYSKINEKLKKIVEEKMNEMGEKSE